MKTSYELVDQVKLMIQLFENASYLVAAEEFQLARNSYLYLETYYPSYEIYNNIGISYLLEALDMQDDEGGFIYPIVIDPTSRLSKLGNVRGTEDAAVATKRLDHLKKHKCILTRLYVSTTIILQQSSILCVFKI